jgi:hypothetical protein
MLEAGGILAQLQAEFRRVVKLCFGDKFHIEMIWF